MGIDVCSLDNGCEVINSGESVSNSDQRLNGCLFKKPQEGSISNVAKLPFPNKTNDKSTSFQAISRKPILILSFILCYGVQIISLQQNYERIS
jgi:hypothetical protein